MMKLSITLKTLTLNLHNVTKIQIKNRKKTFFLDQLKKFNLLFIIKHNST